MDQTFPRHDDAVKAGYFSRRHKNRDAHEAARANPTGRTPAGRRARQQAAKARKRARTDAQQLATLEKDFPSGAKRERAKLQARIGAKAKARKP